jgi:hypothetical protein
MRVAGEPAMQDEALDKPGSFYLGRQYQLADNQVLPAPVLYDSANLTTHAVCVGMTGSGKTGLCLSLLEEAALDGVPAIAIDPKGDLGNLLLTFPELRPEDFRPWVDPSVAQRKGITPEQLAEQTAELWKNGLAKWGEDGERIRRFEQAVDRTIYTPGSSAGVPLTILKSFAAPPAALLADADALGDRVQGAASGLLALLGLDDDPVNSREHILLANVLEHAWRGGRSLDLSALIHEVQQPPFQRVGVVDLDTFFPAKDRLALGMKLNNLLASPSFASWLVGEPLDVHRLLYTADGKPRLSILSIAHLSESERMFFVTILLNEVVAWMRTQPGSGSLRAIIYMDEVFGYFPPTANPPSKRPMLTLMKQARAYGVGCVLATQNPVDLDYKGLSNAGTWFLGRLQTERDKLRVIEGLEGASTEAGSTFNRRDMEAMLAALDSRVFLMNNVHAAAPTVFHTRWAMSYLAGPLTRAQIATLMAEKRATPTTAESEEAKPVSGEAARDAAAGKKPEAGAAGRRPLISADIQQRYWPVDDHITPAADERLVYRPALWGTGRLHFVRAADDVDVWCDVAALQSIHGRIPQPPWDGSQLFDVRPTLAAAPQEGAGYADLPSDLAVPANYRRWDNDLKSHVYQYRRLELWECEPFDVRSRVGESADEFQKRLKPHAIMRLQQEVAEAEIAASEHRFWWFSFMLQALGRLAEIMVTSLFGRRSRKQIVTSTLWGEAMRNKRKHADAKKALREKREQLRKLEAPASLPPDSVGQAPPYELPLTKIEVSPRKADIEIDPIALMWLPWWIDEEGRARTAY